MNNEPFSFLTVTWAADLQHISLLRASLKRSALAHIPHHIVVQDEHIHHFHQFAEPGVTLYSSAEILPAQVESSRKSALVWQQRLGRRGTNLSGSIARYLPRPKWVRYTGWHTQQLSKLAFVRQSEHQTVVILDSDVIVTPHARESDFLSEGKWVCHEDWRPINQLAGKVANWQQTARTLFNTPSSTDSAYDGYYDTPFVMHAPLVRGLCRWLEKNGKQPWWQALVGLPPRRWSEFGIYKQYLREMVKDPVDWRDANFSGYIFDASNAHVLTKQFDQLLNEEKKHFITLHSQNSGRQRWSADAHKELLMSLLIDSEQAEQRAALAPHSISRSQHIPALVNHPDTC